MIWSILSFSSLFVCGQLQFSTVRDRHYNWHAYSTNNTLSYDTFKLVYDLDFDLYDENSVKMDFFIIGGRSASQAHLV